jgi:hypothetical protein
MNPQIKQKWLSALRSGEYQQGRCYLRTNSGFCCLGVLCDLYGKEHNVEWELVGAGTYYEFQDEPELLPLSVAEWAGVDRHRSLTLGELNDTGSTFNEIADLIEKRF